MICYDTELVEAPGAERENGIHHKKEGWKDLETFKGRMWSRKRGRLHEEMRFHTGACVWVKGRKMG